MGGPMQRLFAPAVLAMLALGACAPSPDTIAAIPLSAGLYDRMSCSAARAERSAVAATLAGLESAQRDLATSDMFGVLLIGVPVSLLTHGDRSGVIAEQKGRIIALDARIAGCA